MTSVHAEPQSNQGMLGIDNRVSSEQSTSALANEGRALDPHTSIPEEDESNETASETQEPITPSSDSANTDFHHHEGNGHIDPPPPTSNNAQPNADMKLSTPFGPASKPVDIPRSSPQPQKQAPAATMTPQKEGIGRRVGSFVKKGLSRTKSNTNGVGTSPPKQNGFTPTPSNPPSAAAQARERPSLDTTVLPAKPRRFSSFSLSGRNTPVSQSTSPPSPLSPSSTINSEHQSTKAPSGHKYSRSHTGFNGGTDTQSKPRQGITWGLNYQRPSRGEGNPPRPRRRRSASQEIVPQSKRTNSSSDDSEEGPRLNTTLYSTFSKHADEGTGLKARRLSTSLPDEFMLDFCELKKEFKKVRPIKRKRVGQGATASVFLYECKDANDHRLYAVKQFRTLEKGEDENDYQQKVKSEYSIAKSLHHPNIVETVRLCTEHDRWNHVMEYCDYGEIFTLVQKGLFFKHYKYEDRMCLFKQLLRGVCYLHDHGIAHRDIKLENLLMNKAGHLKISDFGVSECFSGIHPGLRDAGGECGKNMGEIRPCNPGICGSLPYIAPEVLAKKGPYDPRPLDVWSCAIAFITMSFGGSPWNAANKESDQYRKYKEAWDKWLETHPDGQITDSVDGTPKAGKLFNMLDNPALKRLMLKMLNPDPSKRITIQEVVGSNIMKSVECCTPEDFEGPDTCGIDASGKGGAKSAMKMKVQKKHNHLPPKDQPKAYKILKHRFDMGDGWS